MRITVSRLLVLTLLFIIGVGAVHKYAINLRIQKLASRLDSTYIDLELDAVPLSDAVAALRQRLAATDSYFANCEFKLEDGSDQTGVLVSLTLTETSGGQCLRYITELTLAKFELRPGTVIISNLHHSSDHRGPVERAADSTMAWLASVKDWTKHKLGLTPAPPPPSPLAPPAPDPSPKNPFGL
jgi:hypothetical protein